MQWGPLRPRGNTEGLQAASRVREDSTKKFELRVKGWVDFGQVGKLEKGTPGQEHSICHSPEVGGTMGTPWADWGGQSTEQNSTKI